MKKRNKDPQFRITYHPRHVTVIPRPYRKGSRLLNLHNVMSSGGLLNQHKGQVSPNARRKIRTAIDWLVASAEKKYLFSKKTGQYHEWYISFCTLTLPTQGELNDKQVKHILNAWLQYAKHAYGLRSYIWKAEPQKRGTIHIHITSDCFMWHKSVRYSWNRLLKKYQLLNGHDDPNSTDIHSTYKVKNIAAYLCKYFTKDQDERRSISGRLWGCSRSLSNSRGIRFHVRGSELLGEKEAIMQDANWAHSRDYCDTFYMPDTYMKQLPACRLKSLFNARIRQIRKRKNFSDFEIYSMDNGALINGK